MGVSNGDGDGGEVDGDGFRGQFPAPEGCRNRDFCPLNLASAMTVATELFVDFLSVSRVFPIRRLYGRRGGIGGALVGPDNTQAWARVGPRLGGVWPPSGPPSGVLPAQSSLLDFKVLSICPMQFREYFLYIFSEIQKQQKTGTRTMASC